ncbi:MAG: ANTAR domain-containing protein [Endomicrobium sp.]|jgi:response regulator NasT|nr:ANTAR domain-containing protein [Endomicrobium sp.]
MDKAKIIFAGSESVVNSVKKQLEIASFTIMGSSISGNEALRKVTTLFPDIVITDYNLTDMTGLDFAQMVEHSRICPVIVLADFRQSEYVEELKKKSFEIFCITKPIDSLVLNHTISLILRLTRRMHEYEHQVDELKHKLEDRKLIEKAKGILMKKFDMDEDDAYKEMQKKAMNSSKQIVQIAKTIIDMFKFIEEKK